MEVPGMEEAQKADNHMTSAAAFVEGGIQEACDDACSICLEDFCESDPATLTSCKHEFHLQCILEWCQRSSQCPMCWQSISLKDPSSQELLEAVERERSFRFTPSRSATIFHHPTLGDFELQHVRCPSVVVRIIVLLLFSWNNCFMFWCSFFVMQLPVGANDPELEERIIQHLAAAAAMGRAHHIGRREGPRSRSSAHGRPHFLVFSTHPNASPASPVSASLTQVGGETGPAAGAVGSPSIPLSTGEDEPSQQLTQFVSVQTDSASASGSAVISTNREGFSFNNRQSSSPNQDRAGPSELQSFSESMKSRFNAMSMRYKESISKSTRGWKERLFSRNTSMAELGSEVQREVNAGIASVSRLMERLETREDNRAGRASVSNHLADHSVTEQRNQNNTESRGENPLNDNNTPASFAANSVSN